MTDPMTLFGATPTHARRGASRVPLALLVAAWVAASAVPALGQEPATRAEVLRREREQKAQTLTPPSPGAVERWLLRLEDGRVLERLLNPAEGFYPKLGNITPGSGIAMGPAYRRPNLIGEHVDLSAFAVASFDRYWMLETTLSLPRLAQEKIFADVTVRRSEFPEEEFYGLGPDSKRDEEVHYRIRSSSLAARVGVRLQPWLSVGGGVEHLAPRIGFPSEGTAVQDLFGPDLAPGLGDQPNFLRYTGSADLNYRFPRGNPRRGGRYALTYGRFDDRDLGRYSFSRVDIDLQQYVPIYTDRRVLAFRASASMTDAEAGQEVPFYLQPTLGGPDDLRGFRRFRFRDRNSLLLQAEYRWEIFTAVDGALFYDAGKVAPRSEDLDLRNLESDYGIGFRFGSANGVFLRVDAAFGSSGGKHLFIRYAHVF